MRTSSLISSAAPPGPSSSSSALRSGIGKALRKPGKIRIEIADRDRIDDLKLIDSVVFKGVKYSNEYYADVTSIGSFSRIAFVDRDLAGAICCYFINKGKEQRKTKEVNVSTIGIFEDFRRQGVGTKLMNEVIEAAIGDPFVTKILLNVHKNDTGAISFYKHLGFRNVDQIELHRGASLVMELLIRIIP